MRGSKLWLGLIPVALMLSACAAPRPTEQHWGEAQRAASDAMIRAATNQPDRGIDGAGAAAAHENYVESLQPAADYDTPSVLLDIVESD